MLSAFLLTLLLTGPVPQQPRLSDEQIDQVIATRAPATARRRAVHAAGRPRRSVEPIQRGFAVMLTGPAGRI